MEKEQSFFAKQLRKLMFEKDLTQKELACMADTKQQRISEWMTGKNPSLSSIKKLAKALDVSANYFIEEKSLPKSTDNREVLNTDYPEEKNKRLELEIDLLKTKMESLIKDNELFRKELAELKNNK